MDNFSVHDLKNNLLYLLLLYIERLSFMKFLFDLGGVFFDWDPNHFFINIFNDPKERNYFLKNICNDAWNIQQDAG